MNIILRGINIQFSFFITLYLISLIIWSNFFTIYHRVRGIAEDSVSYCRRLEKSLTIEVSELNFEDMTGTRLWHDSELKVSSE
jgi:hypothetical protein